MENTMNIGFTQTVRIELNVSKEELLAQARAKLAEAFGEEFASKAELEFSADSETGVTVRVQAGDVPAVQAPVRKRTRKTKTEVVPQEQTERQEEETSSKRKFDITENEDVVKERNDVLKEFSWYDDIPTPKQLTAEEYRYLKTEVSDPTPLEAASMLEYECDPVKAYDAVYGDEENIPTEADNPEANGDVSAPLNQKEKDYMRYQIMKFRKDGYKVRMPLQARKQVDGVVLAKERQIDVIDKNTGKAVSYYKDPSGIPLKIIPECPVVKIRNPFDD